MRIHKKYKKHLGVMGAAGLIVKVLLLIALPVAILQPLVPPRNAPINQPPPAPRSHGLRPTHLTTNSKPPPTPESSPMAPVSKSPFVEKKASDRVFYADGQAYPLRTYRAMLTPNDPNATQWWTTQTGLPSAWDYGSNSSTIIAVIDAGFALGHQEFANRWAQNSGEQGLTTQERSSDRNCTDRSMSLNMSCNNIDDDGDGISDNESGPTTAQNPSVLNCSDQLRALDKSCNMIDDDANGLVDDVKGWDFASFDSSVQAGQLDPSGSAVSHGTNVTGIAAATGNNGLGIAGVNWNAKILPLQALDDGGYGNTLTVSRAIRYAADRGAQVINLSLGATLEDSYLRQSIAYALRKGAIVVAAAGNDGCNCISYPAEYPEVVAVGASTSAGAPASFSSYGSSLDVMAPGTNMRTTSWSRFDGTSAYATSVNGTSFAAPYVSGLLATARDKQPNATWGELVAQLTQSADHKTLTAINSHSDTFGYGYVKADAFLNRLVSPYAQSNRYFFSTGTADPLGATSAGQCEADQLPTAPLYEVVRNGTSSYTISELTRASELASGATVTLKANVCTGLPTDALNVYRVLNPNLELSNTAR